MNRCILLLVLGIAAPVTGYSWNTPGHMAIAGLAYDELTTAEQSRLVALLKKHPDLSLINRGFPDGLPDDRALVMAAATWPDLAKQSPDYHNTGGYEENEPAVTQVTFDHKMHKGWHFIDTPLWVGHGPAPQLPPIPRVNAVGVIGVLRTQLRSNESEAAKAYDLCWLLHLVGDLHQPLHAVTGVTTVNPKGDHGGNDVKLVNVKGETELHGYWDNIMGQSAGADRHTHLPRLDKDHATADEIVDLVEKLKLGAGKDNVDPAFWAAESFKMAKSDVYDFDVTVVPAEHGEQLETHLDDAYAKTALRDAKKRIRLAGHRLALVLKEVLQ